MNFRESSEQHIPSTYDDLVRMEIDSGKASNEDEARKNVELTLFNERISQFTKSDLVKDEDGNWKGFEKKVREIFPEIPDNRFKAMKAAVTMQLCDFEY